MFNYKILLLEKILKTIIKSIIIVFNNTTAIIVIISFSHTLFQSHKNLNYFLNINNEEINHI